MGRKQSPHVPALVITLTLVLAGAALTFAMVQSSKPRTASSPALSVSPTTSTTPGASPKTSGTWSTLAVDKAFGAGDTVPPVPELIAIRTGSHRADGYDRIAFDFKSALPGYKVSFASLITRDGSGEKVNLPGKAFLKIVFNPAAAHDGNGDPSLTNPPAPAQPVTTGYGQMQDYVMSGDFESYLSFGLGLVASSGFRVADQHQPNGLWTMYVDVKY
jgi:hypothetical protein